jgi:adenosylcobinamide-GDP ribazoletransferase
MDGRPNSASLLGELAREVRQSAAFLTILPATSAAQSDESLPDLPRAARSFPLVGALIGAAGGIVLLLAITIGLPPLAAALVAVGATIVLSGGLHEDGLADTIDGFGGGKTMAARLEIMRDSRIGSFGVLALIASTGLRVFLIAAWLPAGPWQAAMALVASEAAGRGAMVWAWAALPAARPGGLSASLGAPDAETRSAALVLTTLIGIVAGTIAGGVLAALVAIAAVALAVIAFSSWSRRMIGGQTGDVLGAIEQIGAIVFLLSLVAFR